MGTLDDVVETVAEVLLAVAAGGMLWSAVTRVRRGQVRPVRCPHCGRAGSRAYARCPHCGRAASSGGP
ncbi:MAG: hypothetical protein M3O23_04395 [Actinomycetota bacterium]|nr:hypothetical protein [Actinomycetota bacterium]